MTDAIRALECAECGRESREVRDRLKSENEKLRELVGELLDNLMPEICDKAWWCQDKNWRSCNDDACGNHVFVILANELGIEVD